MNGRAVAYWVLASALTLFGMVAIFSIGAPFFVLGVTLLVVGPFRRRRAVFVPAVAGVLAFIVAFILVTPLECATMVIPGGPGHTTCTNIIGIDYSGNGSYNPSLLPALIAALVAAAVVSITVRMLVRRHSAWTVAAQ